MVIKRTSRSLPYIAKSMILVVGFAILVVATHHLMQPNRIRDFYRGFDRSVRECKHSESVAYASYAMDAADACKEAKDRIAVEKHCIRFLREERGSNWMEQLVAFHVLESRPAISDETVLELRNIDESRQSVSDRLDGVDYILKKFASAE